MYAVGSGRPPEQAQILWQRALDLADPMEQSQPLAGVIDVLSAAGHDPTTLAHALALGRTQLRDNADAIRVERAVRTLARAVNFLGIRPEKDAAKRNVCHGA